MTVFGAVVLLSVIMMPRLSGSDTQGVYCTFPDPLSEPQLDVAERFIIQGIKYMYVCFPTATLLKNV